MDIGSPAQLAHSHSGIRDLGLCLHYNCILYILEIMEE